MKQINLLNSKASLQQQKKITDMVRKGVVIVGMVVLLSVAFIFYLLQSQVSQKKALEVRKKNALVTKTRLAELETQAHLIDAKVQFLKKFIDKEPHYRTYLDELSQLIPVSSNEATLLSVSVDNKKLSSVQLAFSSETTMETFLHRLEQDDTQKQFKKLSVKQLSVEDKALSKGSTLELELQWNE